MKAVAQLEAATLCPVMKQKKMKAVAQLTFSFSFSSQPQPERLRVGASQQMNLSENALTSLQTAPEVYHHGSS